MDKRISRAEYFINSALLVSLRSSCERLAVGAVIVSDNRIIATGYNGPATTLKCSSPLCDPQSACTHAIHAEANAIYFAAKKGIPLQGTTIYCTHSPCKKCAEAIAQAGIIKVVYLEDYRSNEGLAFLEATRIEYSKVTSNYINVINKEK